MSIFIWEIIMTDKCWLIWKSSSGLVDLASLKNGAILFDMFPKNPKATIFSPNRDTDFFYIVAGVLQGDTLAQYQLMVCLDYVLRTPIDLIMKWFYVLKKTRSRRYRSETITDADHADNQALLGNTPAQAGSLLNSLKQVARAIGLYANPIQTEFTYYKQDGASLWNL